MSTSEAASGAARGRRHSPQDVRRTQKVIAGSHPERLSAFRDRARGAQHTVHVAAQAARGFSFVALGDSRPMMYLPYKEGQPETHKLFMEMFGLVMPEKVAEAVVKRDVKLNFDPVTKDLFRSTCPCTQVQSTHARRFTRAGSPRPRSRT